MEVSISSVEKGIEMITKVSYKEKKILKLIKDESFENVLKKMKYNMKLLDPQIYYNLDLLKKKGLLKVSKYLYKITIKGRLVLIFDMFKKREYMASKQKQFNINQDFFENYLPKNEDMIE